MTPVERIRELCAGHGVRISALERDLGYANGYFGGLKKGVIPYERAVEVAKYFHTTADYILIGKKPKQKAESGKVYYFSDEAAAAAQEMFEDPKYRMLMDASRKLSPEDLDAVQTMIDALLRKEGK